jgi:hypothetical protein
MRLFAGMMVFAGRQKPSDRVLLAGAGFSITRVISIAGFMSIIESHTSVRPQADKRSALLCR